jgi:integrase
MAIRQTRNAWGRGFGSSCSGVRVTELAGAEIKEFERLDDAKNATWTIPAARAKNGKAHVVPLSRLALSIVVDLLRVCPRTSRLNA